MYTSTEQAKAECLPRPGERMRGADAILRSLEAEGVEVMFGLPGGAILPTYDAIARGTTIRHVQARHEQGAGHMAEGYARASGNVGVALATSGPGATNLVTAIADAWMDSTPLVCITGQVRSDLIGTDAFQECDIVGVTRPIVKGSWQIDDPTALPAAIRAAFALARDGRCGPVLIDVPKDVQEAEFEYVYPDDLAPARPEAVNRSEVARAALLVESSERPILYVGGGVVNADACSELRELAERGMIPVVTTLMAKGAFPESHQLSYGCPGMHGSKYANWALNKADLLIAVGARFDDRVTSRLDTFAPGARVVHLDADPDQVGKLRQADVGVVGSLRAALDRLSQALRETAPRWHAPDAWREQLDAWRRDYPYWYQSDPKSMKPQAVLETLRDSMVGREVVWTTGVGQHQMWAMQYLRCDEPRAFITSGGLGTMGYGLPAAIGAKAARPDATVICIDGDGCFQMTCNELTTSVAENLPIVAVVLDNGSYGMVRQWQDLFYDGRRSHTMLSDSAPDYAALAAAYGAHGYDVSTPAELSDALQHAVASEHTSVLRVRCDQTEDCYPMIQPGAAAIDVTEDPRKVLQRWENGDGGARAVGLGESRRGGLPESVSSS